MSLGQPFSQASPCRPLKTAPKSTEFFLVEGENGKSAGSSPAREENVKIYQKLMRISSQSKADETLSSLKTKSKSSNEKEFIVVSEEEFYEINNIERENVGFLINDYFDLNFDKQTLQSKKQQMNRQAERFHHEHRVRIHEFYEKTRLSEPAARPARKSHSFSSRAKPGTPLDRFPDWFSKYNLNFIHLDLMVSSQTRRDDPLLSALDEEKCLKKIMKIYKDNKTRFWIDNHHYNRVIGRLCREKILKPCCRKAEYTASECHRIKYSLITFYKFMEEILKDIGVFGRLWVMTYDYYFKPENFLFEIIKMFFIPKPLFLSREEERKFVSLKILPKQKRILSLLGLWVEARPEDFHIYKNLGVILKAFLFITDLIYKGSFSEDVAAIREKLVLDAPRATSSVCSLKRKKEEDQILMIPAFSAGKQNHCYVLDIEKMPTLVSHESAIFFAIDPDTLVQQFCLIDDQMYKQVRPHVLCKNFKSPTNSNCLNRIIQRYNFLTYYFILTIILQRDNNEKAKIIQKFLEIAEKCEKYKNFQSLLTVCNALSHLLVLRFKKAWELLSPAAKKLDERIKDLVCFNKNYKKLRTTMRDCKPPLIPCLNIILRDLNQLDGDNEWVFLKDKEFLNLKKMEDLYGVVDSLTCLQKQAYAFARQPFFYDFFENKYQKVLEYYVENTKFECVEERLFEMSKLIEGSANSKDTPVGE